MILGEYFKLFDPLIGLFIIFIPVSLGMIYICIRMERDILRDQMIGYFYELTNHDILKGHL